MSPLSLAGLRASVSSFEYISAMDILLCGLSVKCNTPYPFIALLHYRFICKRAFTKVGYGFQVAGWTSKQPVQSMSTNRKTGASVTTITTKDDEGGNTA